MISVIIPNVNSGVIDRVIAALLRQTAQQLLAEIIVVGRDDQRRIPGERRVRFVSTARVLTIGQARNLGARLASGDYLLFLDADCVATERLLERFHARHAEGRPVVGGSIMPAFRSYWDLCDHTIIYAHFLAGAAPGPRRYLPGGALTIRRDLFEQAGAFDEDPRRIAGEDMDLSLRLRRRGVPLFFEPGATVYHHHPRPAMRQGWGHLYGFGRMQPALWRAHGFPSPLRRRAARRLLSAPIALAAPLLALGDVLGLYRQVPAIRRQPALLPGLVWLKTAWYLGAARAIGRRPAEGQGL